VRRPFGKLMDMLEDEPRFVEEKGPVTLGDLAKKYGEPVERIMDALDAVRERRGERTYA
jgi:hypothetical protein